MSTSTETERIDELAARLTELRDAYYRGETLVADADYDALEDELRALVAEHPELTPDPNPLEQVGAPAALHAPVRHSRPMLSLEKATTPEQVAAFFDRFPGQPVVVMPKLDGLSLALVYERGRLRARGHARRRDDRRRRHAARAGAGRRACRTAIDAGGRVEVRGELVMLRSTFAAYNAAHPDKPLINPRNAAAGTIRAKDPATVEGARPALLRLRPRLDGRRPRRPRGGAARRSGSTPPTCATATTPSAAQAVIAAIEAQRNELDYDLDGAVLRLADRNAYAAAGTRSNSPRGALAFKFAAEEKTTVLADVRVGRRQDRQGRAGRGARAGVRGRHDRHARDARQPGGDPRARRAHRRHRARAPGRRRDPVRGRRARRVQAHRRRARDRAAVECPSCGQPLTEQGNSRELYCTNVACPAQTVRRLIHWASRAAADIEAVGPVWIERLNEAGLLERVVGLLRAHARAAARVRAHRRRLGRPHDRVDRPQPRRRAAARADRPGDPDGLGGHRDAAVPRGLQQTLEEVADADEEALQQVEDIGPKVAASLHAHLNRETTRAELARLRELGVDARRARGGPAAAGRLRRAAGRQDRRHHRHRSPTRAAARRCRGRRSSGCASARARPPRPRCRANTDMLICGTDVGASKTAKAEKLGVEVVDQDEIWKLLIDAGVA